MTPSFKPFWKFSPIDIPVTSSIQKRSSSSFCGSYFWAIWVKKKSKMLRGLRVSIQRARSGWSSVLPLSRGCVQLHVTLQFNYFFTGLSNVTQNGRKLWTTTFCSRSLGSCDSSNPETSGLISYKAGLQAENLPPHDTKHQRSSPSWAVIKHIINYLSESRSFVRPLECANTTTRWKPAIENRDRREAAHQHNKSFLTYWSPSFFREKLLRES